MGLIRDQHNGLQQALALRVRELEAVVHRLRQQYQEVRFVTSRYSLLPRANANARMCADNLSCFNAKLPLDTDQLDERRGLEVEGFSNEVSLLRKQVARLELKAYGRKRMEQPVEMLAEGGNVVLKAAKSAKNIREMKVDRVPRALPISIENLCESSPDCTVWLSQARVAALEKVMLIPEMV